MSTGFDQVFNLDNVSVRSVSEILDMYIYRITFQAPTDFSFSMAVSLFRSTINMVLLLIADRGAKMCIRDRMIGKQLCPYKIGIGTSQFCNFFEMFGRIVFAGDNGTANQDVETVIV